MASSRHGLYDFEKHIDYKNIKVNSLCSHNNDIVLDHIIISN